MVKFVRKRNIKFWLKPSIFLLAGIIMIGHAARMIYQGVYKKGSAYIPNTFDLYFDWLTLLILGIIVFLIALTTFYHLFEKKDQESSNNKYQYINPS